MSEKNLEAAVEDYMQLRDIRSALKAKFDEQDKKLKATQDKIEAFLLDMSNNTGLNSFRTDAGIVTRTSKTVSGVTNWDTFLHWAQENNMLSLLPKRVGSTALGEYLAQHENVPPPGLKLTTMAELSITRPRASTKKES